MKRLFLTLSLLALVGCQSPGSHPAWRDATHADPTARAQSLHDRLGIEIVAATEDFTEPSRSRPGKTYFGRALTPQELPRAIRIVTDQLAFYPDRVIEQSGLKRIVLTTGLRVDNTRLTAYVTSRGQMYLDAGRPTDQFARAVHHEVFHLLDRRLTRTRWGNDPQWMALNAPLAKYDPGQELISDRRWMRVDPDTRLGFISPYARWSPAEDKAELFEWMAYRPAALDDRQSTDPVLAAKRLMLIQRLASLDIDFENAFWHRARALEAERSQPAEPHRN